VLEPPRARWSLKPSSALKPHKSDGPVWKIGLSSFEVTVSWSLLLSWSVSLLLEPCSTLLLLALDFFLHQTLLRHWPKIYSLAPSSLYCLLGDQQEAHWVPSAPAGDQVMPLPPGKPDDPV
jgi:hypothetical protein